MSEIYSDGTYLELNPSWHEEDSRWKALQVFRMITRNQLHPKSIADLGCGVGVLVEELSRMMLAEENAVFSGYDISPQAIKIAKIRAFESVNFFCEDLLGEENDDYFDLLLIIDVFEHVPDYLGFIDKCKSKAAYKIYHIPLDVNVLSLFRGGTIRDRYSVGHLHYFTAESAIATLKDSGQEIIDHCYTAGGIDLFRQHPSGKRAIANGLRWLFSKFSLPLTEKLLGGYSLLVLTR